MAEDDLNDSPHSPRAADGIAGRFGLPFESLKFNSPVSNGILSAMPDMTNTEEFDLVVQAVKTSPAPAAIVAAFNELAVLREQLKRFGKALLFGGGQL